MIVERFAERLVGHQFSDGWLVTRKLPRAGDIDASGLTGSFFSIGYIASLNGKEAFLKIIDVERAMTMTSSNLPLMSRLKLVTDSHIFECSVLNICEQARLDRVVRIIGQGEISPPENGLIPVPYILFELADGDIRKIIQKTNALDDIWKFRVLHNVAVGIGQLHSRKIAHQDLKPSNVLMFSQDGKGAKIGDLGRASCQALRAQHDDNSIPGARLYAPPEQAFFVKPEGWTDRREVCDLYHLGSLVTFLFSGIVPANYYFDNLVDDLRPKDWGGQGLVEYDEALPILLVVFSKFIESVKKDFPAWAEDEMVSLVNNACHPDYKKRGDPRSRLRTGNPIGIETFVSRFNRLALRASIEGKK